MTSPPMLQVLTFREGLLSRLGHDLKMVLDHFEIAVEDGKVTARVQPESLRVEGAVEQGRLKVGAIDSADREKIRRTALSEVLEADRHPAITLEGRLEERDGTLRLEGDLILAGRRRPLPPTVVRRNGDRIHVSIELIPSRWGIRPYRAVAGALKVQDRVVVEVDLPEAPDVTADTGRHVWKA